MSFKNVFIQNQADINADLISSETPLHIAAENDHLDVVNVLLQTQANLNEIMISGERPLYIATQYGHYGV